MFIDQANIEVKAGDGGHGCIAFRREAHVPHGGPSGGDGGDGGSVIVQADSQLNTLLDFKYKKHYKAQRGEDGRGKDQYGKNGESCILHVPVGTIITNNDTDLLIADLDTPHMHYVLAQGGIGGRGNIHFKRPYDRAPRHATQGTEGEFFCVRFTLKLIAQVGLLGFPNVGKSTFLSQISNSQTKVADYPFTTITPSLGVVALPDDRDLVVVDIPGIIEGAALGMGLGHRFLQHVERTKVLLHLIEASDFTGPDRNPVADLKILNKELKQYNPSLINKPQLVVLNKIDLPQTQALQDSIRRELAEQNIPLFTMSAATGVGVRNVLEALYHLVQTTETSES